MFFWIINFTVIQLDIFRASFNSKSSNSMKFLLFISLQFCSRRFLRLNNFGVNGYLFFYFCLKKKYKIIFINIYIVYFK